MIGIFKVCTISLSRKGSIMKNLAFLARAFGLSQNVLHLRRQICMLNNMNKIENAAKWSKERLDAELEKGYNDMLYDRTRPAAMVLSDVKKKYKV
jgi:hypothetical protein